MSISQTLPTVIQPTDVDPSELDNLLPDGLDIGMKYYKGHQDYDNQVDLITTGLNLMESETNAFR